MVLRASDTPPHFSRSALLPRGCRPSRPWSGLHPATLTFPVEHLLVSKSLPIFLAPHYFCACSDLSLSYEAYNLKFSVWSLRRSLRVFWISNLQISVDKPCASDFWKKSLVMAGRAQSWRSQVAPQKKKHFGDRKGLPIAFSKSP
jgi:hypothetical protein